MAGGIQKGTTAYDADSKLLDKTIKSAVSKVKEKVSDDFVVYKRLNKKQKEELFGEDCFGFAPDGGVWFLKNKLVAVFEAKKQNEGGNANERWWDNATTASHINKKVVYVTYCIGRGAKENKCLYKMGRKANIVYGDNFKFFYNEKGFSEEFIINSMVKTLNGIHK